MHENKDGFEFIIQFCVVQHVLN